MNKEIRIALPEESEDLTRIAFAAKRTWDYPESYFQIWKNELTITPEYISQNVVFVFDMNKEVAGFYSIVFVANDFVTGNVNVTKGFWLEHLFIAPAFQHKGIGRKLMNHALIYCSENRIEELKIFVDPNATKFYEKIGAEFLKNSPSSIKGRDIPVYRFCICRS